MDDFHKSRLHRARLQYENLLSNSSRPEVTSQAAFDSENFGDSTEYDDVGQSRLRAWSNERPHMSSQLDARKRSVSAGVQSNSLFVNEFRPPNAGQALSSPTAIAGNSRRPTGNLFQGIYEIDHSKRSVGDRGSIPIIREDTSEPTRKGSDMQLKSQDTNEHISGETQWDEKSSLIVTLQLEIERLRDKLKTVVGSAELAVEEVLASQELVVEDFEVKRKKMLRSNQLLVDENIELRVLLTSTRTQLAEERCYLSKAIRMIERFKGRGPKGP